MMTKILLNQPKHFFCKWLRNTCHYWKTKISLRRFRVQKNEQLKLWTKYLQASM